MEPRKRIPKHAHSGPNDGGLIAGSTVVALSGGTDSGSGSGATTAAEVSILDTAGYFTATDVEAALAELAAGSLGANDTSLVTVAAAGSTETVDVSVARTYDLTLTADCTLTLTGATTAEAWYVQAMIRQDGVGGWVATWPGSVVWPGGVAPALSTAPGSVDIVNLLSVDGGTTWFGQYVDTAEPVADAHVADTTDAHDASAISAVTSGYTNSASTDVQGVLDDFDAAITAAAGSGGGGGASEHAHVVSEAHLSNGSATTYTLDQAFEAGSVIAWNTTTLARLGVTEAQPDQATVSAAGTAGDTILFDYAATLA